MVTFISQCEKNALKRTRRVLDSFANRIGSSTWQTIITQEGLNAVQKLLKKTASKSTAVSCHWIRSRSRSDYLWVVGNRDEFDEDGIVAVNYGVTKRFIGDKEIMLEKIYANTNGQRLNQHLFAVGYVARELIKKTIPNDDNLAEAVYVAGCWHDIGKIDAGFQDWIKLNKKFKEIPEEGEHIDKKTGKFSWQKYPRHNEFSLLLCEIVFDASLLNNDKTLDIVKHAIYWHHAKPLRSKKHEIKGVIGIYNKMLDFENSYSNTIDILKGIFTSIDEISSEYEDLDLKVSRIKIPHFDNIEESLEGVDLPKYKRYSVKEKLDGYKLNIGVNAKNALARTAIVTADILVSKLTANELIEHIDNKTLDSLMEKPLERKRGLGTEIRTCLDGFREKYSDNTERNDKQKEVAKELADDEINIGILKGSAGCGKSKIALEWALETKARKIYWICPRIQVCQGIYDDLSSPDYLSNSSIEIVTGEIKKRRIKGEEQEIPENETFTSDIVITTIDQIVNSITTHKQITSFMDFMNAHVVFDEYHEYINMQGFNLLFAELIEAKKMQRSDVSHPNTLLVSATPNPLFLKEFLRLDSEAMVGMKSFNNSDYKIEFAEYDDKDESTNPLILEQKTKNTFVISNTAIMAQRSFIEHQAKENSVLFHSKFIKKDKMYLFAEIFDSFKKEGTKKYDVLRSGPVVQASLNITCDRMISEMTHAENFLQRLGRLDRFGENSEVNQYIIAITEGIMSGKSIDGSSRFLSKLDSLKSTQAWYEFLENSLIKESYNINEIYELYEAFYEDGNAQESIRQDLISALKKSVDMIDANVLDPKSFPKSKKDEKGGVKIKKNSLRGNSLFVQMAQCKIESIDKFEILDRYAYEDLTDAITVETFIIEGYGFDGKPDSKKNLLGFMAQKHHNIKGVKSQKDAEIRMKARDPMTPIYLSYTSEELSTWSMEPHVYAQYYAIGLNQPIGILSLQQLKK